MTEPDLAAAHGVTAFYDALAPDYDGMTGFGKRFVLEKPFFRMLVENRRITTALDAGCGTGFHSLLLAQLGVRVTAVDVSEEMLGRLERHGREMDLEIIRVCSDFRGIGKAVQGPLDAVFCMGNTLPHLLGESEIRSALRSFTSILAPGGMLFLQVLNYDRILANRERIQNVRECGGVTFVRFYDFEDSSGLINFNILRLEKKDDKTVSHLNTVPLLPVTSDRMERMLEECGYTQIKKYGSVAMDSFSPSLSKDLVIIAAPG
jgi:SAM-dependent methyltransferase